MQQPLSLRRAARLFARRGCHLDAEAQDGLSVGMKPDDVDSAKAAELLEISESTIREWAKRGLIKAKRDASHQRVFNFAELKRAQATLRGNGGDDAAFKLLKSKKTKLNVIELFSGCGGMALGFENAGLQTHALVEIDKDAVATLKRNRPEWNIILDDIKNVSFKDARDKISVVAGGFPCQAFSYAGQRQGFGDPRGTLFFEFLRIINEVRPEIVIGENVRGLIQHDGGRTLATMMQCLKDAGYSPAFSLVRAQFLDVPQKRERLVIVATRGDLDMPHLFPKERDYTVALRQALKNVPPSGGYTYSARKLAVMKLVPAGGCWRDLPDKLQREFMGACYFHTGGRTGIARRLSMDEPALTLTCNPAQKQTERCHPLETRPLNIREYARIQTFPDEWVFEGSVSSQYKQIGNAVPVNLAYHIGRAAVCMLNGLRSHANCLVKSAVE